MRSLAIALSVVVGFSSIALAQKPEPGPAKDTTPAAAKPAPAPARTTAGAVYPNLSPGELQATPEMWFYEQAMRQYQDPKVAVRHAAEVRAEQRQRRLESMRWFGYSNQRPTANSDPLHWDYSPHWVSNNGAYPSRWNGSGPAMIVVRPDGTQLY